MELLDCALKGVRAVIRSNTVSAETLPSVFSLLKNALSSIQKEIQILSSLGKTDDL